MKKGKKLALLLGTATMALTGCSFTRNADYKKLVKPLDQKITNDVKNVENFAYFSVMKPAEAFQRKNEGDIAPLEYTYAEQSNNYFINFDCCAQKYANDNIRNIIVSYNVSFEDYDTIRNTEKSTWDSPNHGYNHIHYTGDVEKLTSILSHESSKLYSIGNLEKQNEMTDNGMEM